MIRSTSGQALAIWLSRRLGHFASSEIIKILLKIASSTVESGHHHGPVPFGFQRRELRAKLCQSGWTRIGRDTTLEQVTSGRFISLDDYCRERPVLLLLFAAQPICKYAERTFLCRTRRTQLL